jgi:hypothetical protein
VGEKKGQTNGGRRESDAQIAPPLLKSKHGRKERETEKRKSVRERSENQCENLLGAGREVEWSGVE